MTLRSSRRTFLNLFLGGSALAWLGSIFYPIICYLFAPKGVEAEVSSVKIAGAVNSMSPNSGKIIKFGGKPVLLIRKTNGEFVAFTGKCTHLDCIVQYRPDMEKIWCACHNGQFDLNGTNIAGPPPRPLEAFDVHEKGKDVYVSKKA